jgi:hypothetical protein
VREEKKGQVNCSIKRTYLYQIGILIPKGVPRSAFHSSGVTIGTSGSFAAPPLTVCTITLTFFDLGAYINYLRLLVYHTYTIETCISLIVYGLPDEGR